MIILYIFIVNFRIKQTLEENTFNRVMQIALNNKYSTSGNIYKYSSLSIFYSPSKFVHAYKTFYDMLVTFISRKINPYYDDITFKEVFIALSLSNISVVGHPDTAAILGVKFNRISLKLQPGDTLYVAQLQGGRLPEGCTTLPTGFSFKYLKITL